MAGEAAVERAAADAEALRRRDRARATAGADGARLAGLWRQIDASAGRPPDVPSYSVERVRLSLEPGDGQAPPVRWAPQRLGAQTREVLAELGYDTPAIDALLADRTVGEAPAPAAAPSL